jgi:hypothetical protein
MDLIPAVFNIPCVNEMYKEKNSGEENQADGDGIEQQLSPGLHCC